MKYLTANELKLLAECNGKHLELPELFECKSCSLLLDYPIRIDVEDISVEQRYKFLKQNTLTDKRKAESVRAGTL